MVGKRMSLMRTFNSVVALLSVSLAAGLAGCGGSGPTTITIQGPASSNVDPGNTATFTATVANDSNSAGVTWTLTGTGCTGAACGVLSGSTTTTVTYTAPGTVATAFTVTITASSVAKTGMVGTVTVNVPVNLGISTAAGALAGATVGTAYSVTLASAGGVAPNTWTVTTGTLPPGLSLNASTGAITGTPTAAGSVTFTVTVKDSGSPAASATQTFTIGVAAPPAIAFTTTALAGGTVGTAYSASVAATGGAGALTYALNSGALPAGLTLSSAGAISGTPTKAGTSTFTVKATDAYGDTGVSGTVSIVVAAPPAIAFTTTTLAGGTVGTAYSASVSATGGAGALTYALNSGSLPAGLTLSSTGAIAGTPTAAATSTFTVKATDAYGDTGVSGTLSIVVAYPALTISTTTLANGTVGTAYSATLKASGGSGSGYTWTVTSGTGLSAVGLTLSSAGVVSGTPNAGETAGTFVVKVTDGAGNTASGTVTLTVVYAPLSITTTTLPTGIVGGSYSVQLAATGGSGSGYTYTVTAGTGLSATGLTLSTGGLISGTPTTAENAASVTVKVTDSANNSGTATFSVTIDAALAVTPTTLANGTVGTAYSATLTASGGSGSGYTFAVSSGTGLSAVGLTLSTAGAVTGTPTAGETAGTFVVKVTDGAGNTATATITLTVVYPALTVTTANLTNGVAGVAYSVTLTAGGGSGKGFTWTVTSGGTNLTALGLSLSSAGVLSGTTPTAGAASFTVKVTDSANDTATANLSVTINAALAVTTTTLPNGTEGTAYSATLTASGGTNSGYTWAVTGGTGLSAVGLTLSSGGVISGTPTAQEAATQFTVKVTDSGGDTATATLALIVNYAALSISTINIPGAVVSTPYSEQFVAAGGSGNYAWSVTSNAGGLSGESLTLSAGGLLSGTPTTVENVPFTLQVKDATTGNTVSASYTLVVSSGVAAQCTHDGSGNALLNGGYAFQMGGFDPNGNHYYQIGDFTADGSGHITGGNGDVNSSGFATQGEQQYTFTGTYSIGSTDDRGIMTLNSSNASTGLPASANYCFAADTVGSVNGKTVAQSGRIIEADGSGFVVTGFFAIQNTASFTNAALNAGYAFGVQGVNAGSGGPQRAGIIGQMTLNGAGSITGGQIDIAQFNSSTGTTTYQAAVSGGGGTYAVSSTGRGTLTVGSGSSAASFVTYVAGNGNMLLLLSADNINTGTLLFGRAQQQTMTSFTTANVQSTSVVGGIGAAYVSTSSTTGTLVDDVTIGEVNINGSGGLSVILDQNSGGTITSTTTGTGTYTVSSLGYMQVSGVGNHSPNFYLYAPGAGFGMTGDPKLTTLSLLPQTIPSGGFTTSSFSGNYALGTIPPVAYSASGAGVTSGNAFPYVTDGTIVAGAGTLSLTQDDTQAPGLPADVTVDQTGGVNTWALDATYGASAGRFAVTKSSGGPAVVGYIVSPTAAVVMDYKSGQDPALYQLDHQ